MATKYFRVLAGANLEESLVNAAEEANRFHNSGLEFQEEVGAAIAEIFAVEEKGKVVPSPSVETRVVASLMQKHGVSNFSSLTSAYALYMKTNSSDKVETSKANGLTYTTRRGPGGGVLVTADYVEPAKPLKPVK